ncbi:hypothetical protein [Microbacterium sp. TPU 3598]|uniref:hypothetical protein n=1 Tax=Microbacterium sp. TPU 3598 TaxID=1938334 RepID=UPI000BBB41DF|nr:hypothetical protein [Microbacterium sp. TPU 3598]
MNRRGRGTKAAIGILTVLLSATATVSAGASLFVALDASSRDALTSTFEVPVSYCVSFGAGPQSKSSATSQNLVITNTGRLPITVVGIWNGDPEGDHFSWIRLEDPDDTGRDAAVELAVGQAIAVHILSPGNTVLSWSEVLTSDGKTRELTSIRPPAVPTLAVERAYSALPSCIPGGSDG